MMSAVAEHKYVVTANDFDTAEVPGSITNIGVMIALTEVPQGPEKDARVGDQITGTSLLFKISTSPHDAGTTYRDVLYMRCIIFIWKDDTDPQPSDIVDTDIPNDFEIPSDNFNTDRRVKRKILIDDKWTCFASHSLDASFPAMITAVWNVPCYKEYNINLTKVARGNNKIWFQGNTAQGVNKIYAYIYNNIPDNDNAWDHHTSSKYGFVDV